MKRVLAGVTTAVATVSLLSGCGKPAPTALDKAYKTCLKSLTAVEGSLEVPARDILGRPSSDSVTIRTPEPVGEMTSSYAVMVTACVLKETKAPETIMTQMLQANAMSGPGKDSYKGIRVVWSYDGSDDGSGFTATFSDESK